MWGKSYSGGSRGGVRGPRVTPPLFLDQTEARGAEKNFGDCPLPLLFQGLDDRPPAHLKGCIHHLIVGNKAKFGESKNGQYDRSPFL